MRTGLLIGCLLLVVLGVAATGTPEIAVDQPTYDFGSIGLGYMVKHTFVLQNTGDEMLEIVYVRASCGCTTTALSKTQLAPGESVPLEVLVVADHGTTKNVSIYVHSNAPDIYGRENDDRDEYDIKLTVSGAITPKQDYEIAPFELAYDLLLLVDVRDADSYAANHLMGAVSIPANELPSCVASLPNNARLIIYDLAGEAANAAVEMLINDGQVWSYYLTGGLSHWVEVQGDLFLVNEAPLPTGDNGNEETSSGRPYSQGELRSDFYVLIDLRDANSFAAGHLAGAVNIPSGQLLQWVDRIPRTTKVVVYDNDQSLTATAYGILRNEGFTRVLMLLGGLNEWVYQYGEGYVIGF